MPLSVLVSIMLKHCDNVFNESDLLRLVAGMLPPSLNETAYNTTLPYSQLNVTTTNITANAVAAKKRFARWY